MVISIAGFVSEVDEKEVGSAIDTMRKTSKEICAHLIPGGDTTKARKILDFALFEFMKNCLHGSNIEIYDLELNDGSILLVAHDLVGNDHLDPEWCGHLGESAIISVVGEDNYQVINDGNSYTTFLHIIPDEIAARF